MKTTAAFPVEQIRKDFPILDNVKPHGKKLVFFDNGASTQKPKKVIEIFQYYYENIHSNIHRGTYVLSQKATDLYDQAREKVRKFINAKHFEEIIFVRGATEGLNLIANSFAETFMQEGDEVIVTRMEHHANIVPWYLIKQRKNITIKVLPINETGELLIEELENLITEKTKVISLTQVSNTLGTINPIKKIIDIAKKHNLVTIVDGAQGIAHVQTDVQELGCDFYVFSGHKIYAPTGIGAIYGRKELLQKMIPYQGGGDMIKFVTFEKIIFNDLPAKFEAGTPNIEGAIALGAALDYLNETGFEEIIRYEEFLKEYFEEKIRKIPGVRVLGNAPQKIPVFSLIFDNVHPHDVGTFYDFQGIAVRTGHHCTQPLMQFYQVPATSRASLTFYNTPEEIDYFMKQTEQCIRFFNKK